MYASNASIKRGRAPWGWCVTSFVIILMIPFDPLIILIMPV